jgi:hypothetical protein
VNALKHPPGSNAFLQDTLYHILEIISTEYLNFSENMIPAFDVPRVIHTKLERILRFQERAVLRCASYTARAKRGFETCHFDQELVKRETPCAWRKNVVY